jgi:prephenate dehydrogenase
LTVVGLGLLGGSVARGARARRIAGEIVGVSRRAATLAQAQAARAVDRATQDLAEGTQDADLVVLCAPVGALPELVRGAWPHLRSGAVLTDVGSVKAGVTAAADACEPRPGVGFVGGHPMAGSEQSGFAAADPDLFEGRLALLTPTARSPEAAVARVTEFWELLGSHVRLVTVDAHDRGVAAVSHLPHLAAYGLVAAADDDALGLAGPGFADTTRVAESAEALWADIFRANRAPLLESLARYRQVLDHWEALIRDGQWTALEAALGRAREIREKLP